MPRRNDIQKILVIGSGPIVIGQSAEFDYSGTQACKALKQEGYEVVLVNALKGLVFRQDPRLHSVSPRSPFALLGESAGFGSDRLFPAPAARPLRARMPEVVRATPAKMRVAFFTGCSFNYFYPETGIDLIDVLTENRGEVVIAKHQQCCGTPVLVHGDVVTARTLARNNIDAMDQSGARYIVTGCGSCGSAWQHQFAELLRDDPADTGRAAHWG